MDFVSSSSKEKLAYFRIKDLKDVLTQLGLSKQGKKQDLTNRILSLLSNEQATKLHGGAKRNSIGKETVAKIIDDTYRKMHYTGATDLASKSHINSDVSNVGCNEEANDTTYKQDLKVRCPCASSLVTESMIQCEDRRCQIWQHISCVIVPENPMEYTQPEIPKQFYCEICRINRADPFWLTQAHPLPPLKLRYSNLAADGTSDIQGLQATEATFQLTRAERDLLQKSEYDLQIWCILLNDKVTFRMQWPQHADLHVNGISIRTTNRPGSQLLGANGRDDGPVITTCSREGMNRVCLSKSDARVFCFGIRIAKRKTLQQVLSLIPKEAEGERFDDALARVRRCVGGGAAMDNADSDSDLEVVADSITVNLRCPMSGSRMKVAGRFKPCVHLRCFDLETFVELNQRSKKWQCPICFKNYTLGNIIIDPYFNRITTLLRDCEEDIDEIEVKADGCWRVKNEEHGDMGKWHSPDGSLCVLSNQEVKQQVKPEPEHEILKQVKLEGNSNGNMGLKLGIKKNPDGYWEVGKREPMKLSSYGNNISEKFENQYSKTALMSSSATGSYRDGEDSSINQEGGGYFDLSAVNTHDYDSSLNFGTNCNLEERIHPCSKDANIIVLSDSEEENIALISPETTYGTHATDGLPPAAANPMVSDPYTADPAIGTTTTSCLDVFGNGNDFGSSLWPLSSCNQTGHDFQFFNAETNTELQGSLVDMHHNSLGWPSLNGFGLSADEGRGNSLQMEDFTSLNPNYELNGGLADNCLAFAGDDPSLQIFLPTQPMSAPPQGNSDAHEDMSSGFHTDDWISLRLGDSGGSHDHSVTTVGFNSEYQFSKESRVGSSSNAGSLNLNMNNGEGSKKVTKSERPSGPSRLVKPRLCLSMDMDFD